MQFFFFCSTASHIPLFILRVSKALLHFQLPKYKLTFTQQHLYIFTNLMHHNKSAYTAKHLYLNKGINFTFRLFSIFFVPRAQQPSK